MLKVLKFGGSSLADAEQFKKVAEIVKSEPERRYVIASAPGKRFADDTKVTDLLLECFENSYDEEICEKYFIKIKERFNSIISDLQLNMSLDDEFACIKASLLNHAGRDYFASRGEYLNSKYLPHIWVFILLMRDAAFILMITAHLTASAQMRKLPKC